MNCLSEIIEKKKNVDRKVEELYRITEVKQTDSLYSELIRLLEERQNLLITIDLANHNRTINIGGNTLNITSAVIIRDSIKAKVDYLSMLINNQECNLDKLELMRQRDNYYEEYTLISLGILRNDLNVSLE